MYDTGNTPQQAPALERRIERLEAELSRARSQGSAARRRRRGALLGLLLGLPVVAYASPLSIPHSFVNGTVADASEVNANFAAVETAVDDNDTRITALESHVSLSSVEYNHTASGSSSSAFMEAVTGRNSCWLTRINFSASSGGGSDVHECHAFSNGASWLLFASASAGTSVTCRARCLRW